MKLSVLSFFALMLLPFIATADYSKFICPPDRTITCEDFRYLNGNYHSLGEPDYSPYCITNLQVWVDDKSNFCGLGYIKRTWTAFDVCSWLPVSCTQIIHVVTPPEDWVIEFPADLTLECTSLDDLPDFGDPILHSDRCEDIRVNYRDEVFESVEDACYKVVRTWTAINWCTWNVNIGDRVREKSERDLVDDETRYNPIEDLDKDGDEDRRTYQVGVFDVRNLEEPNWHYGSYIAPDPDGYVTHKQIIKVRDSSTPQIGEIPDLEVCIEEGCATRVELPDVPVYDCSGRVTGRWTTDIDNLNAVPAGSYTATYNVTDNCGNYSRTSINIEVEDCAPPTSYCRDLSIDLMVTQMVPIWASDFNVGSFDDCSDVRLAFSPNPNDTGRIFTCDNLGYNQIDIYTIDPAGNFSSCTAVVYIGDSQNACPFGEPARLVGTVFTPDFEYVDGVTVSINGTGDQAIRTNELGFYDIRGITRLEDYSIVPAKDTLHTQGVDNTDLQILVEHVTGAISITDPYQLLAADIDRSGEIDAQDIVALRRVISGGMDHFPNNTSWRFLPKDFEFLEGDNPLAMNLPEIVNINNLDEDLTVINFFAIKVGDLDRSWAEGLNVNKPTQITVNQSIVFDEEPVAFPNPFMDRTTLRFNLAQAETVKLTVTDLAGRTLLTEVRTLDQGNQQWGIDGAALQQNGILLYQLETSGGMFSGKVVKM
ncbi:MAG: T9SS type A sorting domain-containing protein [Saprospiraceae bacterium]